MENLTILIPTLNEESNIGQLCNRLHELYAQAIILVIDDGSKDQTQTIVRQLHESIAEVQLLDRSTAGMHGLTISIYDGIRSITTEYFMVIDGDFQHPPEAIAAAITCFQQGADLVVGRRDHVEHWPFSRKLLSWSATLMGKISLSIRRRQIPTDIMSGYFGGRTAVIHNLLSSTELLAAKGYKILFDILKILPNDLNICEFGYIFKNRERGTSKIGIRQIFEYFKSLF